MSLGSKTNTEVFIKTIFALAILVSLPLFADQKEQIEESIVYVRNGEAVTLWSKKMEKIKIGASAPCLKEIVVRISREQKVQMANPYYEQCVAQQNDFDYRVNAQERGGL